MLEAALDRTYSASPGEAFFTGGGLHTFHNFRNEDNGRIPTLRDALRESINLPFIRLMRDLVRYATYAGPNNSSELLKDDKDPRRQEYLAQFADREGTSFLLRFWKKYQKKRTPANAWKPSSTACALRRSAWPPCTVISFPTTARRASTASCART
nr:hypothetical protein GCM10020185_51050 [Pseudomonas brassicacearum subsp. brassicacearum]